MTTAVAELDLGETIAAAMRELHDALREIVDRGPTDDPGLLDELGRLTGRIRRRITGARKKAEPTADASRRPEAPRSREASTDSADRPRDPKPSATADSQPATSRSREVVATSEAPAVPQHRAVPSPRRSDEITVRLPRPVAGGRHRLRPAPLPLWIRALVILLMVAGVAIGTAGTGWGFVGVPLGGAVLYTVRRRNTRRQATAHRGRSR